MECDENVTDEEQKADELLSRGDFMKTVGMGIGAAGLAAIMGGNAVAAEGEKKGKYMVVASSGGNDPNRAVLALILASVAQDKGYEVQIWMTLEGADLANKTKTERIVSPIFKKFGSAHDLMKKLKDKGAVFGVCGPGAEYAGATGSNKYDFVELRGADWILKNIQDAYVVWM
jgi:predicted peroxiredoxin